jgi:nitrate/nitrite transporter NarK
MEDRLLMQHILLGAVHIHCPHDKCAAILFLAAMHFDQHKETPKHQETTQGILCTNLLPLYHSFTVKFGSFIVILLLLACSVSTHFSVTDALHT